MCCNVLPLAFLCNATEVRVCKDVPAWTLARQILENGWIFARPKILKQHAKQVLRWKVEFGFLNLHQACLKRCVCLTTGKLEPLASSLAVVHLQEGRKGQMPDLYACVQQMSYSLHNR